MAPEKIGRYQIKSELGRGGMATVYEAYDPRFEREVAIKVLPREMLHDPQFRVRFEREAKTIAMLEHPAIVPVYDYGEEEGQPYFVMRYMTGGSLSDRIKKSALTLQEAAHIMNRLAPALDEAHSHGIIHRDMKPGNILFDRVGEPYLSDFGIAKLAESQTNVTGSGIIGTPAYMSPEQAQGETIDGRSDIYALGTILFEMLTGQQPYKGDTPMSVVVKHITEPVPHILDVKPDLPPAIEPVIEKTMCKRREERYATAREFATALNAVARVEATESGLKKPVVDSGRTMLAEKKPVPTAKPAVPAATVVTKREPQGKPPAAEAVPGPAGAPPRKKAARWVIPVVAVIVVCVAATIGIFALRGKIFPAKVAASNTPAVLSTQKPANTQSPLPTDTAKAVAPSPLPTEPPATPTTAPTPTPVGPLVIGGADKIALLGGNDVWIMNVDGSDLQRLTTDAAQKHDLQWTPDGKNVIYISGTCAYMVDIGTRVTAPVSCFNYSTYMDAFIISPDGKQVVVSLDRQLYVVPFDLTQLSKVKTHSGLDAMNGCFYYDKVGTLNAAWSKDGKQLAVGYLNPEKAAAQTIRVMDIHACDKNNPRILDNFPEQRFVMSGYADNPLIPSFDWDGGQMFLLNSAVRNDGYGYLYSYNMGTYKGAVENPLGGCCYRDAHWSPDGNYVIFAYQDINKGADAKIMVYYVPFGTFGTGYNYTPLPLPDGFFKSLNEKLQPALRPVR